MSESRSAGRGFLAAAVVVASVAFLPFLRTFLGGNSFYFRDLSGHFFPIRRFVLDGIRNGEWRFWNPFVHEGEPLILSPFGYLPDLLQLLLPNEFGISLSLALHIPFAAVAFMLLARDLRLTHTAAAAGGLIYALGGFALSTLNLYIYVQTLAWAPLFMLAYRRAMSTEGGRKVAVAALALAMMLSTAGVEVILQVGLLALLMTPPATVRQWLRACVVALLGASAAAVVIAPMVGLSGSSQRSAGFATDVVLGNSVYPLSLLQILIAGFFEDPSNLTGAGHWWGVKFFPNGFPYFLSLYLGPTVLTLAAAGALSTQPLRRRLTLAIGLAVFICMGVFVGWSSFFDLSPSLRFLRFPVKAFFTVHFCVALLAAFGVHTLVTSPTALKRIIWIGGVLGLATSSIRLVPVLAPDWTQWFLDRFLDSRTAPDARAYATNFMATDALMGGMVALATALICLAARTGGLTPSRAALAVTAMAGADLLRAGAGLNQSVAHTAYGLSPEMSRHVEAMRLEGRRYFTCNVEASDRYWRARQLNDLRHEAWILAIVQETLLPTSNTPRMVRSALSPDNTGVVAPTRTLPIALTACRDLDSLVPRLQSSGVSRLLAIDPLDHPALRLVDEPAPERIAPIHVFIYDVEGALPRFSTPVVITRDIPGHLDFSLASEQPTDLTLLEPFARGWRATLNGTVIAIRDNGDGHQQLALPAGRNEVRMAYRLPGLQIGLIISAISITVCLALFLFSKPPSRARP